MRSFVEDGTLVGLIEFGQRALALVKHVPRVECEHCYRRFDLLWHPFKLGPFDCIANVLGKCCELLTLEWLRVAEIDIFDNDPRLLHVGDAEALGRQRRDQCDVLGKFLTSGRAACLTWLQTAVA